MLQYPVVLVPTEKQYTVARNAHLRGRSLLEVYQKARKEKLPNALPHFVEVHGWPIRAPQEPGERATEMNSTCEQLYGTSPQGSSILCIRRASRQARHRRSSCQVRHPSTHDRSKPQTTAATHFVFWMVWSFSLDSADSKGSRGLGLMRSLLMYSTAK